MSIPANQYVTGKNLERDPDEDYASLYNHYFSDVNYNINIFSSVEVKRIQCDEEQLLQVIEAGTQEAVVSCLGLHWVNDLPGKADIIFHCLILLILYRGPGTDKGGSQTRRCLLGCTFWR